MRGARFDRVDVRVGDCLESMRAMRARSVHCVVTSPPYYALRDYGINGQHGLESHFDCLGWATGDECGVCFICTQMAVFDEVWRVLRDDGTCWVNLGDSNALSGGRGATRGDGKHRGRGLRPKNKLLIPYRFALAMQARGWIVRQDVIWHKKSPMPETAKDRPTTAHEYLFLFAKRRYYHYDHAAIAEPTSPDTHARYARNAKPKGHGGRAAEHPEIHPPRKARLVTPSGWQTGPGSHRGLDGRYPGNGVGWGYADGDEAKPRTNGLKPRVKNNADFDRVMSAPPLKEALRERAGLRPASRMGGAAGWREDPEARRGLRNKRSVWTLGPEPFKGSHFATFPTALVEPCILAGCPKGGIVLDPYGGSGTVGAVALATHRRAILCELNPDYASLVPRRINEILGRRRAAAEGKRKKKRRRRERAVLHAHTQPELFSW